MPSILTHHYFADQMMLRYKKTWPFLNAFAPLVAIGSQGPDPFFFFGRAPFKKRLGKETINQFASTLHNQEPTKSLAPLLQNGWFAKDADDVSKAYVLGALTHYVLDRTCHPYIFYRSGFDEQGQLTGTFNADHARLEVEIDLGLISKLGLSPKTYQPQETLRVDRLSLSRISEMYGKAFPKLLAIDTYRQAIEDMLATYRFLYHGSLWNRLLVILIAGRRSLPFSLIHPTRLPKTLGLQALNVTRKRWLHPVTKVPSQQTFIDLIEESFRLFEMLIPLLALSQWDEKAWSGFCQHIDYDGKVVGTTMQYQDPYLR